MAKEWEIDSRSGSACDIVTYDKKPPIITLSGVPANWATVSRATVAIYVLASWNSAGVLSLFTVTGVIMVG